MNKPTKQQADKILGVLDRLNAGITKMDLSSIQDCWLHDENTFAFGSAVHEDFHGWKSVHNGINKILEQDRSNTSQVLVNPYSF